ncbi:MAG: hypothetical protein K2N32_03000 [Clostridia bacterium]|nr:hypothetical protein [Clostridia bacterium]
MFKKRKEKQANSKKYEPRNEFRFNHATKHPNYIFGKDGRKYKAMGITHDQKTFGKNNMPLNKNPNRADKRSAYIRNGIISQDERYMSEKTLSNLSFSEEDYANVKSKRRNYDKRLKRQKKTSKRSR